MSSVDTYKIKARDELVRLYAEGDSQTFNNLPDKQKSIRLARFYVEEIHNKTKTIISEEELEWGTVDGPNDLGCDFICRNDGRVTIVQTKFRKAGLQEESGSVSYFKSILSRFVNNKLSPNKNLKEIIDEIDMDQDVFDLIFITLGRLDPKSQAWIISQQPPEYPSGFKDLEERCEWTFLDETELNVALRSARELTKGVSNQQIDLYAVGENGHRGADAVLQVQAGVYRSLIMTLDARQITRMYKTLGRDALFSLNIRNYIGNTNTNKSIIKTAEREPSEFFLYNNGISCLATKIEVHEDKISVLGLQIINGAQTVKTLVHVARTIEQIREKGALWSTHVPRVLVRITEVPEGYSTTGRARERITQYNNTQNTVRISDFRSNDPVQTHLREQFAQITRNGKKAFYLAKRTDRVPSNTEVVRLEEYAKAVYTFLYDFVEFSGSSSFLFDDSSSGGYVKVFGDGSKLWEHMPEDEFKLRAAIYWVSAEIYSHLRATRSQEPDADARAAIERKWALVFAFSRTVQYVYENEWRQHLSRLSKGDWSLGQDKKGQVAIQLYNHAKAGVIMAYKNAKRYNKDFVHRNWMRGKDTPREIDEALTLYILPAVKKDIPAIPN